jgi:hypothetical protein
LLWLFWRWGLVNYLSRLDLNLDLSLPSSLQAWATNTQLILPFSYSSFM